MYLVMEWLCGSIEIRRSCVHIQRESDGILRRYSAKDAGFAKLKARIVPGQMRHGSPRQPISVLMTASASGSSGNMTGSSVVRAVVSPVRRTFAFTGQPHAL